MASHETALADPEKAKRTAIHQLKQYGESPVPPALLAGLITSYQLRPFRPLPMLFPPFLLFSSYLNTQGYKTDAAGLSATWSTLYLVMSRRTGGITSVLKPSNWNFRGLTKGATFVMCIAQSTNGGIAYVFGSRSKERQI